MFGEGKGESEGESEGEGEGERVLAAEAAKCSFLQNFS